MKERDERSTGAPVAGLDELYADRTPSPSLEERVMEDFRDPAGVAGRRSDRPRRTARRAILQAAAALAAFAVGVGVGAAVSVTTDGAGDLAVSARPSFVLLLWEDGDFQSSDDPGAVAAQYVAWARSVAGSGVPIWGEELGTERTVVGEGSADVVESAGGPARIGGFFVVGAETMEQARRLAGGHPHLARGGTIEIAPIVER